MSDDLLARVCPVCGRRVSKFYGGLCEDCYRASHRLAELPSAIEVTVCRACGSYKLGRAWVRPLTSDPLSEAVRGAVAREVRARGRLVALEVVEWGGGLVRVKVLGTPAEGVEPYEEEHTVALRVRWGLCTSCAMVKSKREAARVQVRARGRPLTKGEIEAVKGIVQQAVGSRRGAPDLVDVVEREGGVDFVFSSLSGAKLAVAALRRELLASVLETRKAVGATSGRRLARRTLRVLLPGFRRGDVIEYLGRLYYVLDVRRAGARLLDLETYSELSIGEARPLIERSRVVLKREELEPALVASATSGVVDLVPLGSQRAVTLSVSGHPVWLKPGAYVLVANVGHRLYLLPKLEETQAK